MSLYAELIAFTLSFWFRDTGSFRTTQNGYSYEFIGCFRDHHGNRAYSDLYKNLRGSGLWHSWPNMTHVVDSCCDNLMMENSSIKRTYFGVQFYGECFSYKEKESFTRYKMHGKTKRCMARDESGTADKIGTSCSNGIYCAFKCGLRYPFGINKTRIVNGNYVVDNWPWMVYVKGEKHICGGVLISCSWILTAAHCVEFTTTPRQVSKIVHVEVGDNMAGMGKEHKISAAHIHPNFTNALSGAYDIALLRLKNPVQLGSTVWPICLDEEPLVYNFSFVENFIVAGWGSTDSVSGPLPGRLKEAVTPLAFENLYKQSCMDPFACFGPAVPENPNTDQGEGPCFGDSGGPFMRKRGNQWHVSAILQGVQPYGPAQHCAWDESLSRGNMVMVKLIRNWIKKISEI